MFSLEVEASTVRVGPCDGTMYIMYRLPTFHAHCSTHVRMLKPLRYSVHETTITESDTTHNFTKV